MSGWFSEWRYVAFPVLEPSSPTWMRLTSLRASWRLQLTALILAPLAVWQLYHIDHEVKSKLWSASTAKIILASGVFLALHFGFWVTSLDYTSNPLIVVRDCSSIGHSDWYVSLRSETKPIELIGGIAAFTGAAISMPMQVMSKATVLSPFW